MIEKENICSKICLEARLEAEMWDKYKYKYFKPDQIRRQNVGGIDGLSGGAPAPCSSPANSYPHSFHQCNQCEKIFSSGNGF